MKSKTVRTGSSRKPTNGRNKHVNGTNPSAGGEEGTFREALAYLDSECLSGNEHLRWPPDSFALSAYVLQVSGGYLSVLSHWPPRCAPCPKGTFNWHEWITNLGMKWRKAATTSKGTPPQEIVKLWKRIVANSDLKLTPESGERTFKRRLELHHDLITLLSAADAASVGVGLPNRKTKEDDFLFTGFVLLDLWKGSLAKNVNTQKLRVLPKLHTPQNGITLRSLSHHLSLHVGNETIPRWNTVPQVGSDTLNILVAPWPLVVGPKDFSQSKAELHRSTGGHFKYVDFHRRSSPNSVRKWVRRLLKDSAKLVDKVHGVVFPEAALTMPEYQAVKKEVLALDAFLIAGVVEKRGDAEPSRNALYFAAIREGLDFEISQCKHHRWKLNRPQVEMYGLGATLDPHFDWWEHIELDQREVHFINLNDDITLCCLVCEDLARQDPVAGLVRSVGPNLVVSLLLDGPQLGVRWPSRYATVLADDPGCSVLTVSSLGMVALTRPPRDKEPSRAVAMWKDARSELTEISLPEGSDAVLLTLCSDKAVEWSADGRSDEGFTVHPRLVGVHPLAPSGD